MFLTILLLIVSCDTSISVEPHHADYFLKYHGGSGDQKVEQFAHTLDGGYIMVGTSESIEGGVEILLIKADQFGNKEWHSTFGRGINDEGTAVEILPDGSGYLVAGNSTNVAGNTDVLLIKVGNIGEKLDSKVLGEQNFNEEVNDILLLNDGNIMIAGSSSNVTKFPKPSIIGLEDDYDFFFPKLDINLTPVSSWLGYWGFGGTDKAVGIYQDDVGSYVIFGTSNKKDSDPSKGENNFYVSSMLGDKEFTDGGVSSGTTDNQYASEMSLTSNGGKLMVGKSVFSDDSSDIYVTRFNSANETILSLSLSELYNTTGKAIVEARGGGFLILGSIVWNANSDIYLLKTDNSGNILWKRVFGGSNDDLPGDLIQLDDGSIVFTSTFTLDNQQKIGLIKTNENGDLQD